MQRISLNDKWRLTLEGKTFEVDLPHTWNNIDGQDGKDGYLRTKAVYSKTLAPRAGVCYLEVLAANSVAEVFLDGAKLCTHEGGYSAFWTDLTGMSEKGGKLEISVERGQPARLPRKTFSAHLQRRRHLGNGIQKG